VFSPHRRGKTPPLWLVGAVLGVTLIVTTAAAAYGSLVAPAAQHGRRIPSSSASPAASPTPGRPITATVVVDPHRVSGALPRNALGLSYEADQLALMPGFDPDRGNLLNLLRTLGPGYLKIGANAVDDYVYWNPAGDAPPTWAKTPIGRPQIDTLARLSAASGWPVELGVNLAHLDAARVADQARYVATTLGDRLIAMECGNEPNGYPGRVRPADYGYPQYTADFNTCASAIEASGARLAGPNTYNNVWIANFARDQHQRLALLTDQPYSLSQHNNTGLTLTDLLSPATARSNLNALVDPLAAARKYNLPLRHDETNSVNLGGLQGVSNVHGTALWAIDYILMLVQAGLSGLNFHGTLGVCDSPEQDSKARIYTPLCAASADDLRAGILTARPLYYGMLMVALMGSGDFLATTVTSEHNVTAYTVRGADGRTRIMVVDKDPTTAEPVTVSLKTGRPPGTKASVLRLTGATLDNPKDTSIAGTTIGRDGTFTPGPAESLTTTATGLTLTLPAGTAALLTL